jgi:hypothetical protein
VPEIISEERDTVKNSRYKYNWAETMSEVGERMLRGLRNQMEGSLPLLPSAEEYRKLEYRSADPVHFL